MAPYLMDHATAKVVMILLESRARELEKLARKMRKEGSEIQAVSRKNEARKVRGIWSALAEHFKEELPPRYVRLSGNNA